MEEPERRRTRLLTSGELARELGLARRTVSDYARDGLLVPTVITPGGQYRWDIEDVKQQMAELRKRSE